MKKSVKTSFIAIVALFVMSSCSSTCITCTVERLDGTVEAVYDEFCGTEEEIDAFQTDIQNTINTTPGAAGWQLKCTEK